MFPSKELTRANQITLLRMLLVPVFVVLVIAGKNSVAAYRYTPLIVFCIAALLDFLDGYIARKFKEESRLGAMLDPLADKLLMISALFVLISRDAGTFFGKIPSWFLAVVLIREAVLIIGAGVVFVMNGTVKIQTRLVGKIATVAQAILVVLALSGAPRQFLEWWILPTTFFVVSAGMQAVIDGMGQIRSSSGVKIFSRESERV
jgi:cardiolipin synthase